MPDRIIAALRKLSVASEAFEVCVAGHAQRERNADEADAEQQVERHPAQEGRHRQHAVAAPLPGAEPATAGVVAAAGIEAFMAGSASAVLG